VCEAGVRHNLSTVNNHGTWQCTYVYCFSDGSSSSNQTENSGSACGNLGGCNTQ